MFSLKKVVKDMTVIVHAVKGHHPLCELSDEALDVIISNTQMNQASLTTFYNTLVNERVRRGLHLPDVRTPEDGRLF